MIKSALEFMALAALKREQVEVRGQTVHIRELSVADRDRLLKFEAGNATAIPAFLVAQCAVTPEGAPLFSAEEAAQLAQAAPEVVDAVAAAIMKLSGLGADEKNG